MVTVPLPALTFAPRPRSLAVRLTAPLVIPVPIALAMLSVPLAVRLMPPDPALMPGRALTDPTVNAPPLMKLNPLANPLPPASVPTACVPVRLTPLLADSARLVAEIAPPPLIVPRAALSVTVGTLVAAMLPATLMLPPEPSEIFSWLALMLAISAAESSMALAVASPTTPRLTLVPAVAVAMLTLEAAVSVPCRSSLSLVNETLAALMVEPAIVEIFAPAPLALTVRLPVVCTLSEVAAKKGSNVRSPAALVMVTLPPPPVVMRRILVSVALASVMVTFWPPDELTRNEGVEIVSPPAPEACPIAAPAVKVRL